MSDLHGVRSTSTSDVDGSDQSQPPPQPVTPPQSTQPQPSAPLSGLPLPLSPTQPSGIAANSPHLAPLPVRSTPTAAPNVPAAVSVPAAMRTFFGTSFMDYDVSQQITDDQLQTYLSSGQLPTDPLALGIAQMIRGRVLNDRRSVDPRLAEQRLNAYNELRAPHMADAAEASDDDLPITSQITPQRQTTSPAPSNVPPLPPMLFESFSSLLDHASATPSGAAAAPDVQQQMRTFLGTPMMQHDERQRRTDHEVQRYLSTGQVPADPLARSIARTIRAVVPGDRPDDSAGSARRRLDAYDGLRAHLAPSSASSTSQQTRQARQFYDALTSADFVEAMEALEEGDEISDPKLQQAVSDVQSYVENGGEPPQGSAASSIVDKAKEMFGAAALSTAKGRAAAMFSACGAMFRNEFSSTAGRVAATVGNAAVRAVFVSLLPTVLRQTIAYGTEALLNKEQDDAAVREMVGYVTMATPMLLLALGAWQDRRKDIHTGVTEAHRLTLALSSAVTMAFAAATGNLQKSAATMTGMLAYGMARELIQLTMKLANRSAPQPANVALPPSALPPTFLLSPETGGAPQVLDIPDGPPAKAPPRFTDVSRSMVASLAYFVNQLVVGLLNSAFASPSGASAADQGAGLQFGETVLPGTFNQGSKMADDLTQGSLDALQHRKALQMELKFDRPKLEKIVDTALTRGPARAAFLQIANLIEAIVDNALPEELGDKTRSTISSLCGAASEGLLYSSLTYVTKKRKPGEKGAGTIDKFNDVDSLIDEYAGKYQLSSLGSVSTFKMSPKHSSEQDADTGYGVGGGASQFLGVPPSDYGSNKPSFESQHLQADDASNGGPSPQIVMPTPTLSPVQQGKRPEEGVLGLGVELHKRHTASSKLKLTLPKYSKNTHHEPKTGDNDKNDGGGSAGLST